MDYSLFQFFVYGIKIRRQKKIIHDENKKNRAGETVADLLINFKTHSTSMKTKQPKAFGLDKHLLKFFFKYWDFDFVRFFIVRFLNRVMTRLSAT